MPLQNLQPFSMMGGLDRSVASLRANKENFYDLFNFKHSETVRGKIQQTPYFYLANQYNQGTYYDGGSQTEPTTSGVRMSTIDNIHMTDYVMWDSSNSQMQVLYQTTVPADETIYTGCRLKVNSITGLGITLGSTLDVEMTGGAAGRWRKNGGGWTAFVPSTTGTSIDGGNATLYHLAASGFVGTETWAWTRLDRSFGSGTVNARPAPYIHYKGVLYFLATDDRMMLCESSSTGEYSISLGYRPVYGTNFTFFDDHLILVGYSATVSSSSATPRSYTIGWSDKIDIHNFVPTDTNEADSFATPNLNLSGSTSRLLSCAVINQQFFAFARTEIYTTPSLGLPLVFSFQKFADFQMSNGMSSVIVAMGGVYLITANDVVFFDGASFRSIGTPVMSMTSTETASGGFSPSGGVYLSRSKELVIFEGAKLYGFQERWGTWYTRAAAFSDEGTNPVKCLTDYDGPLKVGATSRRVLQDDTTAAASPVFDGTSGTVYATPKITFHVWNNNNQAEVKEVSSVYLACSVINGSATYYTTSTDLTFKLHWYSTDSGNISGSPTTDSNATLTTAASDGLISFPRQSFRAIAFEVQLVGTVSKPPALGVVYSLEPQIYATASDNVRK